MNKKPLSPRQAATEGIVRELLIRHGLSDWRFSFCQSKRRAGLCWFQRRLIQLSVHFVDLNSPEEIKGIALHEIAHALVGTAGHGEVWAARCREIGGNASRLCEATMPPGDWRAMCPSCLQKFSRYAKPKNTVAYHCPSCGVVAGRLVWERAI